MPSVTNARLLYAAHPTVTEYPKVGVHFKYVEEKIDLDKVAIPDSVLVKTLVLSSDPFIRLRMRDPKVPWTFGPLAIGYPVDNFAVGIVVRSEKSEYKSGDYVYGFLTFENYAVFPGPSELQHNLKFLKKFDKHPDIPACIYVGVLGMPGETAYAAWRAYVNEKAKTSKTIFINSAAGAVSSVLQYARYTNPHLKTIVSAGSQDKLDMLKDFGADVVFNYKTTDTARILAQHGPIDIVWDHVGGAVLDAALANMNFFGLIIRAGTVSGYNQEHTGVMNIRVMMEKALRMQGILIGIGDDMIEGAKGFTEEVTKLYLEGKIKSRETMYYGIKEASKALIDTQRGDILGKPVIIVGDK